MFGEPGDFINSCGGSPVDVHSPSQSPLQHLGGLGINLPLLGYTGPVGHNLSEVQKVLQLVDNTVCRQKMNRNPEGVSKLQAYMKELGVKMEENKVHMVDHMSPTKSITDYALEKVNEAKGLIDDAKGQVDVKKEKPNESEDFNSDEKSYDDQNQFLLFSCQFCKEMFPGSIPLHQHERYLCRMNEEIRAILLPVNKSPSAQRGSTSHLPLSSHERSTSPFNSFKDHVSVLKTYFAMNTEPNSDELLKMSIAVGRPQEFVKEWFDQWKNQTHHSSSVGKMPHCHSPISLSAIDITNGNSSNRLFTASRQTMGEKSPDPLDHLRNNTPSPLNLSSSSKNSQSSSYTPNSLTSDEAHGDIPLDLSLPKHLAQKFLSLAEKQLLQNTFSAEHNGGAHTPGQVSGPLDLINIKKEVLCSDAGIAVHQHEKSTSSIFGLNPFNSIYTSLPHGAFPPAQATIPGLRPYPGLESMSFLPHMAYAYTTGAAKFADMEQRRKYQRNPGFQVKAVGSVAIFKMTSSPTCG